MSNHCVVDALMEAVHKIVPEETEAERTFRHSTVPVLTVRLGFEPPAQPVP